MAIVAVSHLPEVATLLPLAERPQDFAVGFDDVLYVALAERLLLHDLRGRWPDTVLPTPGFQAWRIAADPAGGVWLLERASGRLGWLSGCVQPARPAADYAPATFRPDPKTPARRRSGCSGALPGRPASGQALALASDGTLALLSWAGDGEPAAPARSPARHARGGPDPGRCGLRLFDRLARRGPCRGAPARSSRCAGVGAAGGATRCAHADPGRRHLPARCRGRGSPFAHRLDDPPRYPLAGGGLEPLYRLSVANLARRGEAASFQRRCDAPDRQRQPADGVAPALRRGQAACRLRPGGVAGGQRRAERRHRG